jgi:hypothetical protein
MGAITVLGFIVWAQVGLLTCKYKVIKFGYMLETFYKRYYYLIPTPPGLWPGGRGLSFLSESWLPSFLISQNIPLAIYFHGA